MMNYTDLISRLRNLAVLLGYTAYDTVVEAADAIEELQAAQKWIPVKTRPMDEEERKEWSEKLGYDIEYDAVIYVSQLPDDGQEVLVCGLYGNVWIDKFSDDPYYGCSFEENGDMDGVVAWMPLPEPPKEGLT